MPETVVRSTTKRRPRTRAGEEVWETTTDGTVYIPVVDARGREQVIQVGGAAGSILRIASLDREIAQDRVPDGTDVFRNGMLRRVDADQNEDEKTASTAAISTQQLIDIFTKAGNAFRSAVDKLDEFNVRRLHEAMEMCDASVSQQNYLNEKLAAFRPQGDLASYRDLRGETI